MSQDGYAALSAWNFYCPARVHAVQETSLLWYNPLQPSYEG